MSIIHQVLTFKIGCVKEEESVSHGELKRKLLIPKDAEEIRY